MDLVSHDIHCVSHSAAPLGERKGVNLPHVAVDLPNVTRKVRKGGEDHVAVDLPNVTRKVRKGGEDHVAVDLPNVTRKVRRTRQAAPPLSLWRWQGVHVLPPPCSCGALPPSLAGCWRPQDVRDLATARALGADFIFASFVRSAAMVRAIREAAGPTLRIIAKIENQASLRGMRMMRAGSPLQPPLPLRLPSACLSPPPHTHAQEGIDAFDEILDAADGIMVARGDLGVQIDPERVFLAQKRMVARANIKVTRVSAAAAAVAAPRDASGGA